MTKSKRDKIKQFLVNYTEECIDDIIKNCLFKIGKKGTEIIDKHTIFQYLSIKYNTNYVSYSKGQRKYWIIRGFSEEEANTLIKPYSKVYSSCSIESIMKKYQCSRERAEIILNKRISKQKESFKKTRSKHRSTSTSLDAMIQRYGIEEGTKRYNDKIQSFKQTMSIEGFKGRYGDSYIQKYNEYCKAHSTSLDAFQRKYGEKEGFIRYNLSNERKSFAHTLDGYCEKYGNIIGIEKYKKSRIKFIETWNNKSNEEKQQITSKRIVSLGKASNESLKVFLPFYLWVIENFDIADNDIFFGYENRKEFFLSKDKFYLYDFTIKSLKFIVEFNGHVFHPKSLNQLDFNHPYGISLTESFNNDKRKLDLAKSFGYNVYVIWDTETPENNLNFLKKCFLHEYEKIRNDI